MIQISIIRADGVPENSDFHLFLDTSKVSQQPSLEQLSYILNSSGKLKIVSKSAKNKSSLYCTFPLSLLPQEGFQWIPLSPNPFNTLEQFPEDAPDPKILILVSNDFLDPVKETSESQSETCENCEIFKLEKSRLQQEMGKVVKDLKSEIDSLTADNEKNKVLVKKFSGMYIDTKKESEILKIKLEEEKKKSFDLIEKLKTLNLQFEENSSKAKMREEFLETLINDREKEYKCISRPIKCENQPPTSSLSGSIAIESLNGTIHPFLKDNPSQNKLSKPRVLTEISNSQPTSKETEIALRRFLIKTNRRGLFVKDQGNMYKFGKKKVFIALKHGNLLCRVGGGFENIEEFIAKNQDPKQSVSPISDKNHKRHRTFDPSGKLDDFEELGQSLARSSPEIEKLIKSRLRPLSTGFVDFN